MHTHACTQPHTNVHVNANCKRVHKNTSGPTSTHTRTHTCKHTHHRPSMDFGFYTPVGDHEGIMEIQGRVLRRGGVQSDCPSSILPPSPPTSFLQEPAILSICYLHPAAPLSTLSPFHHRCRHCPILMAIGGGWEGTHEKSSPPPPPAPIKLSNEHTGTLVS